MTADEFMAAIDQSMKAYRPGDMIKGTVVQISREGVLVDIGYKTEGFIPLSELSAKRNIDPHEVINIGDQIEALCLNIDQDGQCVLSLKDSSLNNLWNDLQNKFEISDPVVGIVRKSVKGGLIVDIGVKAFLPGSLIDLSKPQDVPNLIGQEIEALIIDINRSKGSIVLNRRALLEKTIKEDRQIQLAKLEIGQVYTGKVSGVVEYGAFIEVGMIAGLIHISKMGENPPQLSIGDSVQVEILEIDHDKSRVSLAFKGM